jgi:hypothetical protein
MRGSSEGSWGSIEAGIGVNDECGNDVDVRIAESYGCESASVCID